MNKRVLQSRSVLSYVMVLVWIASFGCSGESKKPQLSPPPVDRAPVVVKIPLKVVVAGVKTDLKKKRVQEAFSNANAIFKRNPCPTSDPCSLQLVADDISGAEDLSDTLYTDLDGNSRFHHDRTNVFFFQDLKIDCGGKNKDRLGGCTISGTNAYPEIMLIAYGNEKTNHGILLAHEFGHCRELEHSTVARSVMYESYGPTHLLLSAEEWYGLIGPRKIPPTAIPPGRDPCVGVLPRPKS